MTKVMLIEDDRTMISLLGTLLDMEGFEVAKLEKFDAVIDAIKKEDPDVILMDIHLENKDGLDILAAMRKDTMLKQKKVIMSSGMDKKFESKQAGADDFLMKPYMPDELIEKIKLLARQVS
jgi:DNA-binding response OmpR family regulator